MQAPTGFPTSDAECRFSMWVESLRKDVECSFGILKKRFRCVKLPFMWKDMRDCEHAAYINAKYINATYIKRIEHIQFMR